LAFVIFDNMKKFDIPEHYKSPIISKVKARRKLNDPLKKDFSPTVLNFGNVEFIIARHFGFCYGVENAIEKSYKAINDNPGKQIYLLSQMIHNPSVNQDLIDEGVKFIQDTDGTQLIDWKSIKPDDIVIIPAFGTTIETEEILVNLKANIQQYNTTCPFVEKVWNRSEKLGEKNHTIVIHGKANHEETKATFSHSKKNAPSIVVKNLDETKLIAQFINNEIDEKTFRHHFNGKMSEEFDPKKHLSKIGVVNQTTMLATETQAIADFLKQTMIQKYGELNLKNHFADTRDTLCYATNDNQSATIELLKSNADFAIVVGGYNSSNTSHLVELLEEKFQTYFIKSQEEIKSKDCISAYDIHSKKLTTKNQFIPNKDFVRIIITSGASCPDAQVDAVIQRILGLLNSTISIDELKF